MVSIRTTPSSAAEIVRAAAWPIVPGKTYDRILTWIGDAPLVLLGAATEGTHDFVAGRAALTRRLIEEHGFSAVAITADAEEACHVNRYVHGLAGHEPAEVFAQFDGFPSWIWRNTAMAEFAAWLHEHNTGRAPARQVGLYGLDAYGFHGAMRTALASLGESAPAAAAALRAAGADCDQAGEEESVTWTSTTAGAKAAPELVRQLSERFVSLDTHDRCEAPGQVEQTFYDERVPELAAGASDYFAALFGERFAGWRARNRHMADTLEALQGYLPRIGLPPKIVVWGRNVDLGDLRATDLRARGIVSLGQLVRERHGGEARLIGSTTYTGTVAAASEWGGAAEVKRLEPALPGSLEDLFHRARLSRFFLPLSTGADVRTVLTDRRLQRAIGLVYRPEQERWNHFFRGAPAEQFDAILHVDESHAVEPLEQLAEWEPVAAHPAGR
jgi:erythromycin esterase-like protein